jgi:hypothetical protein
VAGSSYYVQMNPAVFPTPENLILSGGFRMTIPNLLWLFQRVEECALQHSKLRRGHMISGVKNINTWFPVSHLWRCLLLSLQCFEDSESKLTNKVKKLSKDIFVIN